MAGDTPTPMYDKKVGTPFENGDGIEFRKASEFMIPLEVVNERGLVDEAFQVAADETREAVSNIVELKFPPASSQEVMALSEQIIEARIYRMDPKDTPFLKDEVA